MTRREADIRDRDARNVFTYRQTETYDDNYFPSDTVEYEQPTTDDWTTIEKKPKRELTEEEKMERELLREVEEGTNQTDSVWNTQNGDDWDYRDRRVAY